MGTVLASLSADITSIGKTKNLEFEYAVDRIILDGDFYRVSHQYLIPPGQKENEGDSNSRSFEKVMDIYEEIIGVPNVILLAYDITNLESFQDLEFWMDQAARLANFHTELVLVGTHLDAAEYREVDQNLVLNGMAFLEHVMKTRQPEWLGICQHIEVSNKDKTNIPHLKRLITRCILRSQGFQSFEDTIIPISLSYHQVVT